MREVRYTGIVFLILWLVGCANPVMPVTEPAIVTEAVPVEVVVTEPCITSMPKGYRQPIMEYSDKNNSDLYEKTKLILNELEYMRDYAGELEALMLGCLE